MNGKTVGETIRELRQKKGTTQEQLADMAKVTRETISRLERGVTQPTISTARILAGLLGCEVTELYRPDAARLGDRRASALGLGADDLLELESMARLAACNGGVAAMAYYRGAFNVARAYGDARNASTDADISATLAVLRSMRPALDRFTDRRGIRFCVHAEELVAGSAVEKAVGAELEALGLSAEALPRDGAAFGELLSARVGVLYDGLDGTENWRAGIPLFGCAVAIFDGRVPRVAAVYDPTRHVVYSGVVPAEGAPPRASLWEVASGVRIDLEPVDRRPDHRLLATHLSRTDKEARARFGPQLARLLAIGAPDDEGAPYFRGLYALNTGSLAMAFVAAGQLSTFVNTSTHPWDAAAGEVLVRAIGGRVTRFDGAEVDYGDNGRTSLLACASPEAHARVLEALAEAKQG